jgi:hypothetical protein
MLTTAWSARICFPGEELDSPLEHGVLSGTDRPPDSYLVEFAGVFVVDKAAEA